MKVGKYQWSIEELSKQLEDAGEVFPKFCEIDPKLSPQINHGKNEKRSHYYDYYFYQTAVLFPLVVPVFLQKEIQTYDHYAYQNQHYYRLFGLSQNLFPIWVNPFLQKLLVSANKKWNDYLLFPALFFQFRLRNLIFLLKD